MAIFGGIPSYLDYRVARYLSGPETDTVSVIFNAVIIVMVIGLGLALLGGLAALVHEFGDEICNSLDRRGIRLRPTQRYR